MLTSLENPGSHRLILVLTLLALVLALPPTTAQPTALSLPTETPVGAEPLSPSYTNPYPNGIPNADPTPTAITAGPADVPSWGFTPASAIRIKTAHAILATVTFLVLLPSGGITLRILEHRIAPKPIPSWVIWVHASMQMFGLATFVAAAGCGIYTARSLGVVSHYHPVIGLTLLSLLTLQPLTELLNALFFKPGSRIIYLAHIHLWLGRIIITLGIINGGLGFMFAAGLPGGYSGGNAARVTYAVGATVVWLVYVGVCVVWGEIRRGKAAKREVEDDGVGLREGEGERGADGEVVEMEMHGARRDGRMSVKASPAL